MLEYMTFLTAMTGDSSKPLLVAVCLIVSIVLMVVLFMTGKSANSKDDETDKGDQEE